MLEQYETVLVTGGCGFIGSHLTAALLAMNKRVIVIDNLTSGFEQNLPRDAELRRGDVRQYDDVKPALEGVDVVFHIAANANGSLSVNDPLADFHLNVGSTVNMLTAAVEAKVKRFVYFSSASTYGVPQAFPMDEEHPQQPTIPYGAGKVASEAYCKTFVRTYPLPVVMARPFCVYGPRENAELALVEVTRYLRWRLNGQAIQIVGDPDRKTRDFIHISDLVQGVITLADRGVVGEAYNVGSGTEISMRELTDVLASVTDRPATIDAITAITEDTYRLVADISKLKALGYEPKMDIQDGVRELAEHLGDQPALPGGATIFHPGQELLAESPDEAAGTA